MKNPILARLGFLYTARMKRFHSLLLGMLVLAAPLWPQDKATSDAPKEFGFNFSYSYSSKMRVTSVQIGYQREAPGAKPIVFEETVMGQRDCLKKKRCPF